MEYLSDKDYVAFDTETTGLLRSDKIIGFSVCAEETIGYYVILSYWDKEKQALVDLETTQQAKEFLEFLKSKALIMHNGVFDCMMVEANYQVQLMPSLHTDTLVLGQLLNENRANGLKERAVELWGEDSAAEQRAMKESISANGGTVTKNRYELFKADADLIAMYGAKDAILTLKLFYHDVNQLLEDGMDKFFYDEESMPLLRGPTYDMNNTGLRVDPSKLRQLKAELEAEILELQAFIHKEIKVYIEDKYPGTSKKTEFNIGSSKQLAWLLFIQLKQEFSTLTDSGKEVCQALRMKLPYSPAAKREFIEIVQARKGDLLPSGKAIQDVWNYLAAGEEALKKHTKYNWVQALLRHKKAQKLLSTYVEGIEERVQYGIIRPSFLQHGTTSGRYSSRSPNFQNLPRDDKRVKGCIVSRPGMTFVGADYSQLEPRVFASLSGDVRLQQCFVDGDDFYSVIGSSVYNINDCSLKKDAPGSFAEKHKNLREVAKRIALSVTYGTTAFKLAPILKMRVEEAETIIDDYFESFPSVREFMTSSHELVKKQGYVQSIYGRKRRIPRAKDIEQFYGNASHDQLPYEYRNLLNLAVNHQVQSTGASIVNRAAILCHQAFKLKRELNPLWDKAKIVLQVHDELVLEVPESLAEEAAHILKTSMENAAELPGVPLVAEPKIAKSLAELK